MKETFRVTRRVVIYWIMFMSLFCIISPFIFPFSIWYGFQNIFNIMILILPIGYILRFIDLSYNSNRSKILHIVRDSFVILMLTNIPALSVSISYLIKDGKDYHGLLVKVILIWIFEFIGYTVINEKMRKEEIDDSLNFLDRIAERSMRLR